MNLRACVYEYNFPLRLCSPYLEQFSYCMTAERPAKIASLVCHTENFLLSSCGFQTRKLQRTSITVLAVLAVLANYASDHVYHVRTKYTGTFLTFIIRFPIHLVAN